MESRAQGERRCWWCGRKLVVRAPSKGLAQVDELLTLLPARAQRWVVGPLCRRCDLRVLLLVVVVGMVAAVIAVAVVSGPDMLG